VRVFLAARERRQGVCAVQRKRILDRVAYKPPGGRLLYALDNPANDCEILGVVSERRGAQMLGVARSYKSLRASGLFIRKDDIPSAARELCDSFPRTTARGIYRFAMPEKDLLQSEAFSRGGV
jgi:hypothetical protein